MTTEAKQGSKSLQVVKDIWVEVLGVSTISPNDRFLDIGGNSLNVVEVVAKLRNSVGASISPKVFFDKNTNSLLEVSKRVDEIASPKIS